MKTGAWSRCLARLALLLFAAFTDKPSYAETPAVPADGLVPLWVSPNVTRLLPKQMWLRGGLLFDRPGADEIPASGANSNPQRKAGRGRAHRPRNEGVGWIVPDPVLVDVLENGKLRAHLDGGRTLEGWQPRGRFNEIVKISQLGLFAQVDAPLIHARSGITIGRIFAGSFVSVREVEGDQAILDYGELVGDLQVGLSSLGLSRIALPRRPESNTWLPAWGHVLIFSLDAPNPDKVEVPCAPARKLEDKIVDGKPVHRLSVYADGIEVEGWAPEELQGHSPGCFRFMKEIPPYYPRIVDQKGKEVTPPMPEGYRAPLPKSRALGNRIHKWLTGTPAIFLPYAEGWKITCRGLKVTPGEFEELNPEPWIVIRKTSFGALDNGVITLDHWSTRSRDGTETLTSGWQSFQVVAIHEDKLEVVSASNIRGYHPDDTEFWYRTEQDCKGHATLGHTSTMFGY